MENSEISGPRPLGGGVVAQVGDRALGGMRGVSDGAFAGV